MRPPIIIELAFMLAATVAAVPASAQLYKWVDERGVVTYSDRRPADPNANEKLQPVKDRVSVYSPDKALLQAVEAVRQRRNLPEAQIEPVRRFGPYVAKPAGYDPCAQGDCAGLYGGYDVYGSPVFIPRFRRPPHLIQSVLPPGAIAGTITSLNGMNGMIPGTITGLNGMIPGNTAGLNGLIPGNTAALNGVIPGTLHSSPRGTARTFREPR
jgi:hypothetical protein